MQQYRGIRTVVLLLVAALFALGGSLAIKAIRLPATAGTVKNDGDAAPAIVQYQATRTADGMSVTLLGITKGVAFLDSQELADGVARPFGNNAIPWMKVLVLVEAPDAKDWPADFAPSLDAQTVDGKMLLEPITIETEGFTIPGTSRGTAYMELDLQELKPMLAPTALPKAPAEGRSRIVAFTLSGHFPRADRANLTVRLGSKGTSTEFAFEDVPIP